MIHAQGGNPMLTIGPLFNQPPRHPRPKVPTPGTVFRWGRQREVDAASPAKRVDLAWQWAANVPGAVTAVCACSAEGPFLVGGSDGTVCRLGPSGVVTWRAENPGMAVTAISASVDARMTAAAVSPIGATPGLTALHVLDGAGLSVWSTLGAIPGRPVRGRVSEDGSSVLVVRVAEPHSPALVSVRDAETGTVIWERQIRHARHIVADATPDLRSVIVGYAIETPGREGRTGLVESYRDGRVMSSSTHEVPVYPSLLGSDTVILARTDGKLECRTWTEAHVGMDLWNASGEDVDSVVARAGSVVVCASRLEESDDRLMDITRVSVRDANGTHIATKEFRATTTYRPILSNDGKLLALVPHRPHDGEPPLLMRLDEPEFVLALPNDVTALDFGVGGGQMFVGTRTGTAGVATVPS